MKQYIEWLSYTERETDKFEIITSRIKSSLVVAINISTNKANYTC